MVQQNKQGGGGRQINVDTARVARAEVTRMNVAGSTKDTSDELLSELKDNTTGSIKDLLDKIRQAVVDCCSQDPARVAKGNADLNKNVGGLNGTLGKATDATDDLDKTLSNLNKNIEVLITTMASGGGGGGEGGGGAPGGPDLAKVRQTEQQIRVIGDAFMELDRSAEGLKRYNRNWIERTKEGIDVNHGFMKTMRRMAMETIETETIGAFNSMVESIQDVIASTADLRSNFKKTVEVFKEAMETSATGMVSTMDMFLDDWNQLGEGIMAAVTGDFAALGDSMRNTIESIRMAREEEGLQIGAILIDQANSLDELGQYMKDARTALFEGNKLRGMLDDGAANAAIIEMLGIQKRAGVLDEMNATALGRQAERRAMYLASIAANTGMTVDELLKQNKEETKSLQALYNLGAITQKQFENFSLVAKTMGPAMGDMMAKAVESGFDFTTMMAQNPELKKALGVTGSLGAFQQMMDMLGPMSKTMDPEEFEKNLKAAFAPIAEDIRTTFSTRDLNVLQRQLGPQMVTQLGELVGDVNSASNMLGTQGDGWMEQFDVLMRGMKSWFSNMFPGGSLGLGVALAANTVALIANTAAQMGLGGKLMNWGGKFFGLGKGLISGVGKVGGMLTGLAAKLAPLLLVAAKVAAALAAAAAIGVGIGMLFNKAWEKISEFLGGAGSLGSDIADLVDEFKYGATGGEPGGIGAPKKSVADMTVMDKMKRYGPNWMDAIPGLNAVSMARRMARITGDVRSISGPGSPPAPGAPTVNVAAGEGTNVTGVEGKLDRVASAIEEGNRYARETAANTKNKGGTAPVSGDVSLVAAGSPTG